MEASLAPTLTLPHAARGGGDVLRRCGARCYFGAVGGCTFGSSASLITTGVLFVMNVR